ncbi:MAG: Rha family transcriptional regulator [Shewanella sp.]
MNTITAFTSTDIISLSHGQPITTSLKVAEAFGKRHDNVLRKLESLECSKEFNALNFEAVEYVDPKGEKRPAYEMTKDGFIFVVMGFTGKQAAAIKEAYIKAFNEMADKLYVKPASLASDLILRNTVTRLAESSKIPFQTLYGMIHRKFGVSRIEDMNVDQISDAVGFLMDSVIEGELMPKETLPAPQPVHDYHNAKVSYWHLRTFVNEWERSIMPLLNLAQSQSRVKLDTHLKEAVFSMAAYLPAQTRLEVQDRLK